MLQRLQQEIETALNRKMQTPKDFDYLRDCIYSRLHILISSTTLKRVWGYLNDQTGVRPSTLTTLAQFIGYKDWEDFKQRVDQPKEPQSTPIMSRRLSVSSLHLNDKLRLTWQPDRVCVIEYMGELNFKVVESENTRLKEGDTFQFSSIIEGEPLYIDNLCQNGHEPIAYVCGMQSGVLFEII